MSTFKNELSAARDNGEAIAEEQARISEEVSRTMYEISTKRFERKGPLSEYLRTKARETAEFLTDQGFQPSITVEVTQPSVSVPIKGWFGIPRALGRTRYEQADPILKNGWVFQHSRSGKLSEWLEGEPRQYSQDLYGVRILTVDGEILDGSWRASYDDKKIFACRTMTEYELVPTESIEVEIPVEHPEEQSLAIATTHALLALVEKTTANYRAS